MLRLCVKSWNLQMVEYMSKGKPGSMFELRLENPQNDHQRIVTGPRTTDLMSCLKMYIIDLKEAWSLYSNSGDSSWDFPLWWQSRFPWRNCMWAWVPGMQSEVAAPGLNSTIIPRDTGQELKIPWRHPGVLFQPLYKRDVHPFPPTHLFPLSRTLALLERERSIILEEAGKG